MNLIINGEKKEIDSNTVSELLDNFGLEKNKVVVEINKNIIGREEFEKTKLNSNDKVEIITLVGGG